MRAQAWIVWAVVVAGACAPKGQPTLEIRLTPKTVTDGTPVAVTVIATAGDGTIGKGTVRITSARGSLVTPVQVTLDSYGTAAAELICNPTTEPECAQSVRVVAEWTSDKLDVTAEARLNPSGVGGGGGGGNGVGGGTGGSGSGGGTGGGFSSSSDFFQITSRCSASGNPGLTPSCCFDGGIGAPQCGWVVVNSGATLSIPFAARDGGMRTNLLVGYSASALSDAGDCTPPNLFLGAVDGGFEGGVDYGCTNIHIHDGGSWQYVNGGGCLLGGSIGSNCFNMFINGDPGTAHTLSSGHFSIAGQDYDQADGRTYVFMMRRGP